MELHVGNLGGTGAAFTERVDAVDTLCELPTEYKALIDGPVSVSLVSQNPNGSRHHTPVWLGRDDTHVYVTAVRGLPVDRNLRARPEVVLHFIDAAEPDRRMSMKGVVDQILDSDQIIRGHPVSTIADQLLPSGVGSVVTPRHDSGEGAIRTLFRVRPSQLVIFRR